MWFKQCAFLEHLFVPAKKPKTGALSVSGGAEAVGGAVGWIVEAVEGDALAGLSAQQVKELQLDFTDIKFHLWERERESTVRTVVTSSS